MSPETVGNLVFFGGIGGFFVWLVYYTVGYGTRHNRELDAQEAQSWICPARADATEIVPRKDSGCCEHCPPFHCCSHDVYGDKPAEIPESMSAMHSGVLDHGYNCHCKGVWSHTKCLDRQRWCHCGLPRDHGGLCKTASGAYLLDAWGSPTHSIERADRIGH